MEANSTLLVFRFCKIIGSCNRHLMKPQRAPERINKRVGFSLSSVTGHSRNNGTQSISCSAGNRDHVKLYSR